MPSFADSVLRQRVAWVILGVALVACLGVRLAWMSHSPVLAHDEAITYLHAAGKGVDFAETVAAPGKPPADTWATAGDWAQFMDAHGSSLRDVTGSVTKTDRHPPLYFWMLHVWMSWFGSAMVVGRILQSLLAVLTTLALFALARVTLRDPLVSALSALAFALLPGAIETALFVRQYELLGLFTVIFVLLSVRYADAERSPGWGEVVLLGIVALLGLLTHLYFALVVVLGALWIIVRSGRVRFARVWKAAAAVAVGTAAAWAIAPGALGMAGAATDDATRTFAPLAVRIETAGRTLANGVGINRYTLAPLRALARVVGLPARSVALALGAAALLWLVWALVFALTRRMQSRVVLTRGLAVPYFFFGLTAGVLGLYFLVARLGPAMGPRYLVMTWPFLVLLVALLGMVWVQRPAVGIATLCVWLVVANVAFLGFDRPSRPADVVSGAQHVVVDNLARGVLLPYGEALPSGTGVYAAWRKDLVAQPQRWLPQLRAGDVVVAADEYQPHAAGVSAGGLEALVRTRWRIEPVSLEGLRGSAWRLVAPTSAASATPAP